MAAVVEATGPIKFASISASSGGSTEIVAAVTGRAIRVLSYKMTAAGTVSVKWRSNATDLTGAMPMVAQSIERAEFNPCGHFQTASGEPLNLNTNQNILVAGHLVYQEVQV